VKIANLGERLDLEVRQGSTLGPIRHELTNPDEAPVDLTGCVVRGQVRRKALATSVVAQFDVSIPDPLAGAYEFGLTDEVTATIPCGDTIADAASLYEWDMELEDALGRVQCTFYGAFRVKAEVTR